VTDGETLFEHRSTPMAQNILCAKALNYIIKQTHPINNTEVYYYETFKIDT